ncbi:MULTISPECIES: hypothetical protein [Vitreoscilla]|uniref:Uncharacterized protein n=1 Tax=Vitreoscilla stercoraria TaxID=61 RepID=A0ABY4EIZ2_VITST|nr:MULTISPECIES: hypothetical protein [Vitreoscilla]AUZ05345.1 hypothetical protein ADP71_18220 [Vitreoscilla sp. C1]UOO93342.1 hypothetical protein LVJ81_04755 [Vitreoscilla stercoraria]
MKNLFVTATLLTLVSVSSLAMAGVGENRNAPQLNPHAQSNQQIAKTEVPMKEEIKTNRLNSKEINPTFTVIGANTFGTGSGYSVRVDH